MTAGDRRASAHDPHATYWLIQLADMNARRAAVATRRPCHPAHSPQTLPHTAASHTHCGHAHTPPRPRPGLHSACSRNRTPTDRGFGHTRRPRPHTQRPRSHHPIETPPTDPGHAIRPRPRQPTEAPNPTTLTNLDHAHRPPPRPSTATKRDHGHRPGPRAPTLATATDLGHAHQRRPRPPTSATPADLGHGHRRRPRLPAVASTDCDHAHSCGYDRCRRPRDSSALARSSPQSSASLALVRTLVCSFIREVHTHPVRRH